MRVLLGAAVVAGASASMTQLKAEYDTAAAAAGDAFTPAWPTEVTDAAITAYDTIVDTQTTALVAALDKQTDGAADPDYTAALAAIAAVKAGCETVQALWDTASATGGSLEDATDAQWLAFPTNLSTAAVALAGKIRGKCQVTGQDDTWYTAAEDGTEDGEFENKAACETANKGAGNDTAGTWVPETDNANAATHIAAIAAENAAGESCTFTKGGADLAAHQWWAQRTLTAAELEGLWPTPAPASSADDGSAADPDGSAASPAYALAAGAAAVLALLF